ncbi:preprotein translocase subunit SecG [Lachnospiraceae bacterium C10]|jgi:preprotein translocase subunit SecG|nr:preprotein translocase subunit SecG [Lachnospiraceae bacterium]SCW70341.1 preprotein translocase subunit SecG [Lachnospiraceae bacterium C10]SDW28543.1 preprotein translocase subunit SecG [Lachnospiraceae bacterium KHCPX20]
MTILKTVLMIAFIVVCVALSVIILSQEGKDAGLGSLGGQASTSESYWSRNKGRSREGMLVKGTTVLVVLFFVFSAILNIGSFH